MEFGFYAQPGGDEIDVYISIALVGVMVPEHAIDDPLYPLLFIVYTNLEVIVSSENGIHYEIVLQILFDSLLYRVHGFLQFLLVFSLEHYGRTNRL